MLRGNPGVMTTPIPFVKPPSDSQSKTASYSQPLVLVMWLLEVGGELWAPHVSNSCASFLQKAKEEGTETGISWFGTAA